MSQRGSQGLSEQDLVNSTTIVLLGAYAVQ